MLAATKGIIFSVKTSLQELEFHYSPSRWSHRMGPDEVIASHIDAVEKGELAFSLLTMLAVEIVRPGVGFTLTNDLGAALWCGLSIYWVR